MQLVTKTGGDFANDNKYSLEAKLANQILEKARVANTNTSAFISRNEDWLVEEVDNYLKQNQ